MASGIIIRYRTLTFLTFANFHIYIFSEHLLYLFEDMFSCDNKLSHFSRVML